MRWEIVELAASDTHSLRRTILRDGTSSDVVDFDGDDEPDTLHLGIRVEGSIVAISSWMSRVFAAEPAATASQLRGMATATSMRGTGASAALLTAGLDRCRGRGDDLVWARARSAALTFYERHGFVTSGEPYVDATTGLPHQNIVLKFV